MSGKAPIFEETVRNYLAQVAQIDLAGIAETLAITVEQGEALIPFLGKTYRVSSSGVFDDSGLEPIHAIRIVLCRYLLLAPPALPRQGEDWVSYKDFRDAAPFVYGFVNNSERAIARNFYRTPWYELPASSRPSGGASAGAWNSPTSSPASFRPCPESRCCSCLMTRMKTFRPNAPCCFNAGRKNFWIWNAWLSSAGCWPIPWPKRPAWGNGPSCDRVQTAFKR